MDIYDLKKFGKNSKINDEYWADSLKLTSRLEKAIGIYSDEKLLKLIKHPDLYKGKT